MAVIHLDNQICMAEDDQILKKTRGSHLDEICRNMDQEWSLQGCNDHLDKLHIRVGGKEHPDVYAWLVVISFLEAREAWKKSEDAFKNGNIKEAANYAMEYDKNIPKVPHQMFNTKPTMSEWAAKNHVKLLLQTAPQSRLESMFMSGNPDMRFQQQHIEFLCKNPDVKPEFIERVRQSLQ